MDSDGSGQCMRTQIPCKQEPHNDTALENSLQEDTITQDAQGPASAPALPPSWFTDILGVDLQCGNPDWAGFSVEQILNANSKCDLFKDKPAENLSEEKDMAPPPTGSKEAIFTAGQDGSWKVRGTSIGRLWATALDQDEKLAKKWQDQIKTSRRAEDMNKFKAKWAAGEAKKLRIQRISRESYNEAEWQRGE